MKARFLLVVMLTAVVFLLFLSGCHKPTELEQVSKPVFSPPGGTYDSAVEVVISTATTGATIRYTTNGADPNSSSPVYSSPITVSQNATLKAKATKSGWTDSSITTAEYTISPIQTVATPTFSPPGGSYTSAQSVLISCSTSGAVIRYTTNGAEPTQSSPTYSNPINVSSTTTIKAKGFKNGWTPSATASETYTISAPPPPPRSDDLCPRRHLHHG